MSVCVIGSLLDCLIDWLIDCLIYGCMIDNDWQWFFYLFIYLYIHSFVYLFICACFVDWLSQVRVLRRISLLIHQPKRSNEFCTRCAKYVQSGMPCTYTYTYIYTYIHTYIHMYIYMYIYIYIWSRPAPATPPTMPSPPSNHLHGGGLAIYDPSRSHMLYLQHVTCWPRATMCHVPMFTTGHLPQVFPFDPVTVLCLGIFSASFDSFKPLQWLCSASVSLNPFNPVVIRFLYLHSFRYLADCCISMAAWALTFLSGFIFGNLPGHRWSSSKVGNLSLLPSVDVEAVKDRGKIWKNDKGQQEQDQGKDERD